MTMTDEELNREWKPNARRPQSTVAQMFSQELMDIFRIDNSVADLDKEVDKRKQQITTQTTELEALEARIREMEMRLKGEAAAKDATGAKGSAAAGPSNSSNAPPPPPEKDYPVDQNRTQQQKYGGSRPGTARQSQPAVPGALPPTPAGSEGESEPSVVSPSRIAPRPPGTQAHSPASASKATAGAYSHTSARTMELPVAGGDSDSVKSVSESASFADYVIVPEPDGDRERHA